MTKDLAIVLSDGSAESAVCGTLATQKHRPVLVFVASDVDGADKRAAFARQVETFKPAAVHELSVPLLATAAEAAESLNAWLIALANAAVWARSAGATAIYLPLRVGPADADLGPAAEFCQIAQDLLRHGLSLPAVTLETPLLELEPWQTIDLGAQVDAPFTDAHGHAHHAAFVRAARPKP